MPNLLDIRRRIKSVKNTQQITKAMKMVSAAKLRRAQERVLTARPFANKMTEVLNELAKRTDEDFHHPLMDQRGDKRRAAGQAGASRGGAAQKPQPTEVDKGQAIKIEGHVRAVLGVDGCHSRQLVDPGVRETPLELQNSSPVFILHRCDFQQECSRATRAGPGFEKTYWQPGCQHLIRFAVMSVTAQMLDGVDVVEAMFVAARLCD